MKRTKRLAIGMWITFAILTALAIYISRPKPVITTAEQWCKPHGGVDKRLQYLMLTDHRAYCIDGSFVAFEFLQNEW